MKKLFLFLAVISISCIAGIAQSPVMTFEEKVAYDNEHSSPKVTPSFMNSGITQSMEYVLNENFEGGVPPTGWSVVNNVQGGPVWTTIAGSGESGNFAGSGEAASVSSDKYGIAKYDTELRTPLLSAGGSNFVLRYDANFQNFANQDYLDLDITIDGGANWTTILSWNEDQGAFRNTPGQQVVLNLDSYLVGATDFMLRWRYYDPSTNNWNWYAQIDNVVITRGDAPLAVPISDWAVWISVILVLIVSILIYRRSFL